MKLTREGLVLYPTEPCEGFEEKILLMQSGGLSDPEEKMLMDHLETCAACKTLFQHYELIDKGIREVLLAQQNHPVKEMPKKLQIMLSEATKRHFAAQLQELAQSILFQKPEVCDLIRPWSEPRPLELSVVELNKSFTAVLNDPLMQEVGLTPDFVEDSRQFLHGIVENPCRFTDAESAKEAIDRSLSVEPNHVLTIKSLADYHFAKSDSLSEGQEYNRLLSLNIDPKQKARACINLSSNLINERNFSESKKLLNNVDFGMPNFLLYFVKFKLFYLEHKYNSLGSEIESIAENLHQMDVLIEETETDLDSVTLISKWISKNQQNLLKNTEGNHTIAAIATKYAEKVLDL